MSATIDILDTKKRIEEIRLQVSPLETEARRLRQKLSGLESRQWIDENGATKGNVEMSDGSSKPYFGHIAEFAKWLKQNSGKMFAEWNGTIYYQRDLVAGQMPRDMPGRVKELEDE